MENSDFFKESGYLLTDLIETDCWGDIYRAHHVPLDRDVFLRAFEPAISDVPGAWELMLAELQAWARIDHPGVLQVLDWGQGPGRCFATMQPSDGEPLSRLLSEQSGVEGAEDIFKDIVAPVEAARAWGVLHLGLGPTNIWVSAERKVQVSDYGFWYAAREFPGLVGKSIVFPAPEQLSQSRASAASDVFTLAVIYIARRHGLEAARQAAFGGDLPADVDSYARLALSRALHPQPLARYRCAGDFAGALGLMTVEVPHDYRDCPLCRLKQELQLEESNGDRPGVSMRPSMADKGDAPADNFVQQEDAAQWARYVWIAIVVLATLAAVIWWMALR